MITAKEAFTLRFSSFLDEVSFLITDAAIKGRCSVVIGMAADKSIDLFIEHFKTCGYKVEIVGLSQYTVSVNLSW